VEWLLIYCISYFSFSQAANDGLRGLYMHCFDGPDRGKGFVVLSNGDNPAVMFQCELCRALLKGFTIELSCVKDVYVVCVILIWPVHNNTVLSCFRLLLYSSAILCVCMLFCSFDLQVSRSAEWTIRDTKTPIWSMTLRT